jgi:hypothetical protein
MKYNSKLGLVMVYAIAFILLTPCKASADIFVGSYNTGNITYAFAGAYSTSYQDQLAGYFKQWDAVTTKINMTKAATYTSAKLKLIYKLESPPQANLLGQTYLYSASGTQLAAPGGTWYSAVNNVPEYSKVIKYTKPKVQHACDMRYGTKRYYQSATMISAGWVTVKSWTTVFSERN